MSFSGSCELKKDGGTTQARNSFSAHSVARASKNQGTWKTQENPQLVKIHEKIHTGEKVCKKNGTTTQGTHTWEKAFKCTKCDKSFSASNGLNGSKRTHTVEKLWVHNIWHELPRNRWIEEKWEKHTGEKYFLCPKCGKRFSGWDDLKRHEGTHNFPERTHTGKKAFKWQDNGFSSSNGLKWIIKVFGTEEKLLVHKVWHELPRIR